MVVSPSPRAEDWCLCSAVRQRSKFSLPPIFCSFTPSVDWIMPTHTEEGSLLYSVYHSNANLMWQHPHRHTQNNVGSNTWVFHDLVKWTHQINHIIVPILGLLIENTGHCWGTRVFVPLSARDIGFVNRMLMVKLYLLLSPTSFLQIGS